MRIATLFSIAALLFACGDDAKRADTSASDTSADTIDDTFADTTDTAPDTGTPDTAVEETADTTADGSEIANGDFLAGCGSLFAARIVELQVAADASFPSDCDVALRDDIGKLAGNTPLCNAGETANACRLRMYETPPDIDDLVPACWTGSGPTGCMRASYLPRCADGSDDCAEPEVVCQDGTRPMVLAEAATTAPSDIWHFHLGGEGGPCVGAKCWYNYRFAHLAGDAPFERAMSTSHPDYPTQGAERGGGVMRGEGETPFAGTNRVKFERCTDAASDAVEDAPVGNGIPPELAANFPDLPVATETATVQVWHRGYKTWLAAFHHMTTLEGRDRDGDGVPEMPSLADARVVILSGSSDASTWVMLAADRFADELRAIAGDDVDVRIMIDGHFSPMIDNEGRYHADAPADFDVLSDGFEETGLCLLPDNGDGVDNEACSDENYAPGGELRAALDLRGVVRDASCEAFHGAGAAECYDMEHTLFHHVSLPFLVLADQEDATVSGSSPTYAEDRSYHWDAPATYRERVLDQGWDLVDFWATAAREEGAGVSGDMVLIFPKSRREGEPWGRARHVRFGDDEQMAMRMTLCSDAGAELGSPSFAAMLVGWVIDQLPQNFAIEDAAQPLANGSYWVTGNNCRPPE